MGMPKLHWLHRMGGTWPGTDGLGVCRRPTCMTTVWWRPGLATTLVCNAPCAGTSSHASTCPISWPHARAHGGEDGFDRHPLTISWPYAARTSTTRKFEGNEVPTNFPFEFPRGYLDALSFRHGRRHALGPNQKGRLATDDS